MEPEERIRRMEEDGILSERQAAMLRDSLAGGAARGSPPPEIGPRRRWTGPVLGGLVLAIVAVVLVLAVGSGGGGDQVQDVAQTLNQPGEYGQMNKSLSGILAAAALLIVPLLLWMWLHNSLVAREERVFEAWAQTESNFQRRADLVPALVDTVSRYLKHESETLTAVTEGRTDSLAAMTKAIEDLAQAEKAAADLLRERGQAVIEEETALRQLYEAQSRIGRGTTALLAVAENYPELRSSDQFLELQAQLEGTENRINVARMRFNETVRDYNRAIRQLPGALVAQVGNFNRKAYFRSEEEARDAPKLGFD
ncbi:MAG TPA: LemA family protein [Kiloniellales bacterium]